MYLRVLIKLLKCYVKEFFLKNRDIEWSRRGIGITLAATLLSGAILGHWAVSWLVPDAYTYSFRVTRTEESIAYAKEAVDDVRIKEQSVNVEEEKSHILLGENIDTIVDKVYRLESSSGKNDSCRNKGLWNGYGYAQSTFTWNCYESHEEVRTLVVKWFEKHLQDKTLAESLCYYNLGIVQSDCKYYQNYLSL